MPNSDLDWDSGKERKKGKDHSKAEDTTYDKMTDEEREELPGKIEQEIVGPRPAVPIASDVFDKKGWDKTYRRHAITNTKANTWLNLDDRFIGEKKVTDDGCLPSLEEYKKLMLGQSIPKLLNCYNELGGVVEDILK
ncbi:hypothetical protein H0H81_004360 [Sphagnurus paluster]|uniref:Uncharacterized protein n=1 Tax=Sphagnurus paluster TaxID=117069 RepID=A0A9P7FLL0_9AGAR|nr:hypothetical protein H0H81_004360 [Sphagnurus paluster]